jgi:hypothetical protein
MERKAPCVGYPCGQWQSRPRRRSGSGASPSQELEDPLHRLSVHITIHWHATTAKLDLDDSSPFAQQAMKTAAAVRTSMLKLA